MKLTPKPSASTHGLNDKNGKRIWENDIVYINNNETGVVEYRDKICGFTVADMKKQKCCTFLDIQNANAVLEVIGNIFDTPELLKEQ